MKKKNITIEQFSSGAKNLDGASESFLDTTAPLIGYIVHSFNDLEELLSSIICQIICDRTDAPGLIVIHKLNYSSKVDLFEKFSLMEAHYSDSKPQMFNKLIKNLFESGRLRNQVVHAAR